MTASLSQRIDDLEWQLHRLEDELQDLRRDARAAGVPERAPSAPLFDAPAGPPARPPVSAPAAPAAPAVPAAQPPLQAPAPSAAPRPAPPRSRPPRRELDLGVLLARLDLVGAGGLAVVGGAVTALGIALLFVLAADRGWIGPEERLLAGAAASSLVFAAGLVIRRRYGRLAAALAAVGAGIAGAYATLAAAAALYDLIPDAVALPLAALIAAVAVVVSLSWGSEMVAALGLLGAALAPALQAVDAGIQPDGVAFAVLVLVATAVLGVLRRWELLLASVLVAVGAQVAWLVDSTRGDPDPAVLAVTASFAAIVLGTACAWQLTSGGRTLARLAGTVALADVGFVLLATAALLEPGTDRGIALAVATGAFGLAWLLTVRPQPDLALLLGSSALGLGAVALAGLLSGDALTLTWAAEAILLTWLASRLHDARLQVFGLAYLTLALCHLLSVSAPADAVFERADADAAAAVPVLAVALAALAAGLLAPERYRQTAETGPLAFLGGVRRQLLAVRRGLRETLFALAAALGVLAAGIVLVDVDFDAGHLALSALATVVAAGGTAAAARLHSPGLVTASLGASFVVLVEALSFDAAELHPDSLAGWSLLFAGAGLLAAGISLRVLWETPRKLGVVSGFAATPALAAALIAVAAIVPAEPSSDGDPNWIWYGVGVVLVALVYLGSAAVALRVTRLRNLATTLWALGLVAVLVAEFALIREAVWYEVAVAVTAAVVVAAGARARELRLWVAGAGLLAVNTLVVLVETAPPRHLLSVNPHPADGVIAVVAVAAAGVAVAATAPRSRHWILGAAAALDLYALSLVTLELAVRISGASLETDFERGHTVVSAIWALTGLALLVAGLARRSPPLRYAGFALFGLTLAKIFLYDLAELSSVARAASFLAVGGLLLAGGFVVQRLSETERGRRPAPR